MKYIKQVKQSIRENLENDNIKITNKQMGFDGETYNPTQWEQTNNKIKDISLNMILLKTYTNLNDKEYIEFDNLIKSTTQTGIEFGYLNVKLVDSLNNHINKLIENNIKLDSKCEKDFLEIKKDLNKFINKEVYKFIDRKTDLLYIKSQTKEQTREV